jgi:tripartite ATP-independent transporter DctP family solute receptor
MVHRQKQLSVLFLIVCTCLAYFLTATQAFSQEKQFNFTFAGVLPKGSLTAHSMDVFADRVNKESNGRIVIKTIHGTSLGGEVELIESIRMGSLDGGCFGSVLGSFYKKIDIWNVPYLFRDDYWLNEVLNGHIGTELLNGLETVKLKGLGWFRYGARGLGNNVRPITKPEDIKGLKIRTIENNMCVRSLQALGAIPVTMSTGDAIMAMRQKVIDGIDFPQSCLNAFKLDEMLKFFSFTQHTFSPVALVMGTEKFKSLPGDLQQLVLKVAKDVGDYHNTVYLKQEEARDRCRSIEKLGDKIQFSDPDKEPFRRQCIPTYATIKKDRPDLVPMMDEIIKLQDLKIS